MAEKSETTKESTAVAKPQTASVAFTNAVMREMGTIDEAVALTPYQKKLAQHLFIKIDASIKDAEVKRQKQNSEGVPIVWANINMNKLALDAMHRIELGLDALIPNHISPIAYFNKRLGKYDIDLRIGYVGKDFYRRQVALDPPEDIVYELVYEKDVFRPIKKSFKNPVESYEFDIPTPFDRGKVVGGFAYVTYSDQKKNKLIIVTDADFKKSESKAGSKEFWGNYPEQMKYKTIVNRATNRLNIDPAKVNESFMAVEAQEDEEDWAVVEAEIEEKANKGKVLEIATRAEEEQDVDVEVTDIQQQEEPPKAATAKGPGF
jgi:recombination protein RecT